MTPASRRDTPEGAATELPGVAPPGQVDGVDEAGNESFPASDPPSWWAGED